MFKKLFKNTLIYGLATVLPKMIGFIMAKYHIKWLPENAYADYTLIFAWMMFFNVILSFGMETAFFRFYNKRENKKEVINNTLWFLMITTTLFGALFFLFKSQIDSYFGLPPLVVTFLIITLLLDALSVIPFAIIRANENPTKYSIIKVINVCINALLSVVLLYLIPEFCNIDKTSFWSILNIPNFEVGYLFLANLIASVTSLLFLLSYYKNLSFYFNKRLQIEMIKYSFPVMIGGLAFVVNEVFDRVLIEPLLPKNIAKLHLASYGAMYKVGVFMVLFRMAYSLGIEPFFFSYSKQDDAPQKYALITKFFVIFGSFSLLFLVVISDFIKENYISNESYWHAMEIVPYILLANFMLGIYTNLSVWYKLKDKTRIGAYLSIGGAMITIVLNYLLIPRIGIVGSAITTLVAYAFMMILSYILGQKHYPIPYDVKSLSTYLTVSITMSFVYFYNFRENYWLGLIFCIIFVTLILVKEKKQLIRIINEKKK